MGLHRRCQRRSLPRRRAVACPASRELGWTLVGRGSRGDLPGPLRSLPGPRAHGRDSPDPLLVTSPPEAETGTPSMKSERASEAAAAFRLLPSVEEVLQDARGAAASAPRARRSSSCAAARRLARGDRGRALGPTELEARLAAGALSTAVAERLAAEARRGIVRAINATGVVLHTGLGRAPVHPEAAAAMARGGGLLLRARGRPRERRAQPARRAPGASSSRALTGAEAAIAVNNNAGGGAARLPDLRRRRARRSSAAASWSRSAAPSACPT